MMPGAAYFPPQADSLHACTAARLASGRVNPLKAAALFPTSATLMGNGAGAVVHAQGGEMQTFFPCSNPACEEGSGNAQTRVWHCLPTMRVAPRYGWRWRESAEDDACL
jgi:hypothetical protein